MPKRLHRQRRKHPASTRTWKTEPRTSQPAREQRRRGNTDETGGKMRWNSQGAEERPSVGPEWKMVEAPCQNHREPRKLDEPELGGRQSKEPGRPPKAPDIAGRMDWVGTTGKQKSWTPPQRRERATTGRQPPRILRDTNRRLTKKEKEVRTRGSTAPARQIPQPRRPAPRWKRGWSREE